MANKVQQQAYMLLDEFDKAFEAKTGRKYKGNKHSDKWAFIDIVGDLGYDRTKEVIAYYFKTRPAKGHDRKHFIYHYHEYEKALTEREAEQRQRKAILARMKEEYEG